MTHPNEALVRRFFDTYGQPGAVQALFSSDAEWYEPGVSPISGRYVGPDAIAALVDEILELSGGTFRVVELVDVLVNDRHGLALVTVEGTHEGRTIVTTDRVVFTFTGGAISEVRVLSEDQAEVDAFWD